MGEVSTLKTLTERVASNLIPYILVCEIGRDAIAITQENGTGFVG